MGERGVEVSQGVPRQVAGDIAGVAPESGEGGNGDQSNLRQTYAKAFRVVVEMAIVPRLELQIRARKSMSCCDALDLKEDVVQVDGDDRTSRKRLGEVFHVHLVEYRVVIPVG